MERLRYGGCTPNVAMAHIDTLEGRTLRPVVECSSVTY